MSRFAGKTAIVTGAAQGIGKGIAERLAREGAAVVIADIYAERGVRTAELITTNGGQAHFVHADVTDETAVAAMVGEAVKRFGRLDILVNNAGASPRRPFTALSLADWHSLIDLNLTSMFLCVQHALPHLKQSSGACIVNIASLHAFQTVPGLAAYAAAKGGVVALTRSMAIEFAPNVRVNAVAPGVIETEAWFNVVDDVEAARQHRLRFHLVSRLGQPEDIAAAVAFLASEDAAFITGVTLPVDGGLTTQLYRE
jgi:NAD(P)-dependent dehydrogenase (short-subunit alcohol dehydrogenase family)